MVGRTYLCEKEGVEVGKISLLSADLILLKECSKYQTVRVGFGLPLLMMVLEYNSSATFNDVHFL